MSEEGYRKIISRVRRKNRGSSALENLPAIEIEPKEASGTWKGYRESLDNFYTEETTSQELMKLLDSVRLSGAGRARGLKAKLLKVLRKITRPIGKTATYDLYSRLIAQERFNSNAVLFIQRLINLTKKSNDVIANKIEQMETKFDALIGEIVHKYLVNFTNDLVSRMDILYRRLDQNFISHDVEIEMMQTVLKSLQEAETGIKAEFQDFRSVLGSQRRAVEEMLADFSTHRTTPQVSAAKVSLSRLKDMDYLVFENRFRGSSELIKERQSKYVEYFKGRSSVLDIACGRGEFLELLEAAGVKAEGVDLNEEMAAVCKRNGLKVVKGDVLTFLKDKAGKYDGIFCSNLVEHLSNEQLSALVDLIRRALVDKGVLVIETVNPESLVIFAATFYLDLTHTRPIHPLGMEALLEANGFSNIKIIRSTMVADEARLEEVEPSDELTAEARKCFTTVNRNIARLNDLLFNYQEYGIVAYRMPL